MAHKLVYFFGGGRADGSAGMKDLLGGKGAGLAEMTNLGIPVPPGFTITTEVCTYFYQNGQRYPEELRGQVEAALRRVEDIVGARLADEKNPLLVSVRSGARASMPGMMDTVLNLGLFDRTVRGLIERTGNPRFAFDSYRRFVAMYGDVVMGLKPERKEDRDPFEVILEQMKHRRGVEKDHELRAQDLEELTGLYKAEIKARLGRDFPEDPAEQLWGAIGAVFGSWQNKRAVEYRRIYNIPAEWGTAVNVQAMVFGNMGEDCATGVAFTRDPGTGAGKPVGEYLINAQGEDVVAGIRTPAKLSGEAAGGPPTLERAMPDAFRQLEAVFDTLEKHYRDMQDVEFTIQNGKLWILQTRAGKRTALAMVRTAVEMAEEGLIKKPEALSRIEAARLPELLVPVLDDKAAQQARAEGRVIAKGLPASRGGAVGKVVFHADDAIEHAKAGEKVILVRWETSPEDVHGMHAAAGILTATGGMTCVAGETRLLTERGLIPAEQAFELLEQGATLRLLSFETRELRPVWRNVVAAGRRPADVVALAVSMTGRADQNLIRLTADHKLLVLERRRFTKKPVGKVLADEDFVTILDRVPPLVETATSPSLAYVAGAILSDGYIRLTPTKGAVTFVQKPTPEKATFIAAVEAAFLRAFGVPFTYVRERHTEAVLKGRVIRGSVEDRICFRRQPAAQLAEIRDHLATWVLGLDRVALLHFLAGYIDGDGSYAEESSAVRLQITVSAGKPNLLEGLALACLRLGIVPQITSNRDAFNLQIAEQVDEILAFTQRVRAEIPPRYYESRCLAMKSLFGDIVDSVNFMGRVREALKRNLLFGAEKIRRDILPLCPGETYREVAALLDAPVRSFRAQKVGAPEAATVYNFEVDAAEELDKNFVAFSSRLTPVLVSNSHAAVVARGMGKCCVVGASGLQIDYHKGQLRAGGKTVRAGETITIDGGSGEVFLGEVTTLPAPPSEHLRRLLVWADELRRLRVRANGDTPEDARRARAFGAEGIGLCRTEHMFFEPARILAVREMIFAGTVEERRQALAKILPMQRGDFVAILREMAGLPVTIRLLDPPLHEFLPQERAEIEELARALGKSPDQVAAKNRELHEQNPMLGHRGCRLAVTYPEIYEMQARAIAEAAAELKRAQVDVRPEIMIPIVGHERELFQMRALVVRVVDEVLARAGVAVDYTVGTMIELPRACVQAGPIAEHADFFSFGTNDLTQTTFGLSRDDAGRFLPAYVEAGILPADPFVELDQDGVGDLMKLAVTRGRAQKPKLKLGICGEHGGDPSSIQFCHSLGLDYVSCSPFRVYTARVAAAQASLKKGKQPS